MLTETRFTLLLAALLVLLLAGCGSAVNFETAMIDDTTVVRDLKYYENGGQDQGPLYTLSITVPEDWIGQVETQVLSNRLAFNYIGDGPGRTSILHIEALSEVQYWEQIGSYPGDYTNIANKLDTYFVYTVPVNAATTSLSDEQLEELLVQIPGIIDSFSAETS
jgi:hypothetical protein